MLKAIFILLFYFSLLSCSSNTVDTTTQNTLAKDNTNQTRSYSIDKVDKSMDKAIAKMADREATNKAIISLKDSSFSVAENKYLDHQIFGYAQPDTSSKKLLLLSVFTYDVEKNPYKCPYGAYYSSFSMDSLDIKFVAKTNHFVKCKLLEKDRVLTDVYFESRFVEFEE